MPPRELGNGLGGVNGGPVEAEVIADDADVVERRVRAVLAMGPGDRSIYPNAGKCMANGLVAPDGKVRKNVI